jgi:hypothetical protein
MHSDKHIWDKLTRDVVKQAAFKAAKHKRKQKVIQKFLENPDELIDKVYFGLKYHKYDHIPYNHKILFNYKKKRILSYCDFEHRIVLHTLILLGDHKLLKSRTDNSYNCIPTYGVNSKVKNHSLNHRIKSDTYETDYWGWCQLDLRKCYQSTNGKIVKRAIIDMYGKGYYSDILQKSSVCELGIPVGTPMSPRTHHMVLLKLDHFCVEVLRVHCYRRYADDIRFMGSREELNTWSWRIRFFLFYECDYLVKDNLKIRPIRVQCDIGGYVYHKTLTTNGNHNKGFTTVRKSTKQRAKKKPSEPAYFGIFKHADSVNLMNKCMEFSDLKDRMMIQRKLDSPEIDIKELEGISTYILGFDARPPRKAKDKKGEEYMKSGWCKVQVAYIPKDSDGKKKVVRIFKGAFDAIAVSLHKVDEYMDELRMEGMPEDDIQQKIFPIKHVYFDYESGWLIRGTNKQLTEY